MVVANVKKVDNDSFMLLSFFLRHFSHLGNPNPHQTSHTNKNCYYTSPIREQTSENNILKKLAN